MQTLKGNKIYLRALEPTDIDFLFETENNESIWELSHTITPYSKYILQQYINNAHQDIFEAKQLRLVICISEKTIGFVDLFDFDPKNKRAGLGIVITDFEKNKGYGTEAIQLLLKYTFTHLQLHQVYVNINEDNIQSIKLFDKLNFSLSGVKKDWNFCNGIYKNEHTYQLINTKN